MAKKTKGVARKQDRKWTEAEARAVLAKLKASGKSLSRFARERGLTEQRLYWWKARLGKPTKGGVRKRPKRPHLAPVVLTGVGMGGAAAIVRIGPVEFEVIDPARVAGRWVMDVAEALGAVS